MASTARCGSINIIKLLILLQKEDYESRKREEFRRQHERRQLELQREQESREKIVKTSTQPRISTDNNHLLESSNETPETNGNAKNAQKKVRPVRDDQRRSLSYKQFSKGLNIVEEEPTKKNDGEIEGSESNQDDPSTKKSPPLRTMKSLDHSLKDHQERVRSNSDAMHPNVKSTPKGLQVSAMTAETNDN